MPACLTAWTWTPRFQSAPGREAGRCINRGKRISTIGQFQSAPGREAGRCTTHPHNQIIRQVCFNPRPAVRPGDANPIFCDDIRSKCFNPRPAVRPGDAWLGITERGEDQGVSIRARP